MTFRRLSVAIGYFLGGGAVACGATDGTDSSDLGTEEQLLGMNGDEFGHAVATGDFDGDGRAELAIGVPGKDLPGKESVGVVMVYNIASGTIQTFSQDSSGVADSPEAVDRFGEVLSVGNFNGDAYDDLAIGVPFESINASGVPHNAGAVHVLYGSGAGLTGTGSQFIYEGGGAEGTQADMEFFGRSLAVGDFNHDGHDDLAIGVDENLSALRQGAVYVFPGSPSGLNLAADVLLHQDQPGVADSLEAGDSFGSSVAACDLNNDQFEDLVVGVPGEGGGSTGFGAIHVFFGSATGISVTGNLVRHQDSSGIAGAAEAGDKFGASVACGRFNGDAYGDIAIGVPGEDVSPQTDTGAVNFIFGSATGPTSAGNYYLHQDSAGVPGATATGNGFGQSLAIGDYDANGLDDISVGVPGYDVNSQNDAGAAYVFFGASGGPSGSSDILLTQDIASGVGSVLSNEYFGRSIASGDYDGDGNDDIAIGVPEDSHIGVRQGSAHALRGTASGITWVDVLTFRE